ncbi:MAG: DnaB-like helicase N-terminal domain-containing protein, partial [Steroidobacteraceae bacterium]
MSHTYMNGHNGDEEGKPLDQRDALEQYVLGALLIKNEKWQTVRAKLTTARFKRKDHQLIFGAIQSCASDGRPFDVMTVSGELTRTGNLEHAGGLSYLGTLARGTATAENVETYVEMLVSRDTAR